MNKASMTGNALFDFLRKKEVVAEQTQTSQQNQITTESRGLLGDAFLANGGDFENLKDYEVMYDSEGNLVYEVTNGGTKFTFGEGYELRETPEGGMATYSFDGDTFVGGDFSCGCNFPPGANGGTCTNSCSVYGDGCTGSCTGDTCSATGCKKKAARTVAVD